ncbi:MAG: hypothetical protein K2L64_02790 [Ureaplasma sp.]|nr:hypothetical protein [Ureaplasma sp.]
MLTKIDDCFINFPEQITDGINTTIKLINDYKDYDDTHHSNWSFLLFPIFTSLEGIMQLSLEELGIEIKRNFFCFKKENNWYKLKNYVNNHNLDKINNIEICYNIYANNHHKYFHYQKDNDFFNDLKITKKSSAISLFKKIYMSIKKLGGYNE